MTILKLNCFIYSLETRSGVVGSNAEGDGVSIEVADLAKRAAEAKVAVIQALERQYVQLCSALQNTSMLETRLLFMLATVETVFT